MRKSLITSILELSDEAAQNCPDGDCLFHYRFGDPDFVIPLIDISENPIDAHLTKNVTARQWQSQDGARFMRAGFTVLAAIEVLMEFFQVTDHLLRPDGSGYRTKTRNDSLDDSSGESNHLNGTAADITLIGGPNPPAKCEVLAQAEALIGGKGEIQHEGKKVTVHIAIPARQNNDKHKHAWSCE